MKILQLCKKVPYPPKDGEAIAIFNITKGISELGNDVTVLAMNTPKHSFNIEDLPTNVKEIADFNTAFVDTSVSVVDAFLNVFGSQSYNIQRFYSLDFEQLIIRHLLEHDYDIIHLEGVYLAPYIEKIRPHTQAPIVMRSHNVESEIWERLATEQQNYLKKPYFKFLANRLKNFEIQMLGAYDALVPISMKDAAYFMANGFRKPLLTVPASVDSEKYVVDHSNVEWPSLFFIGSLDWMPNQKGLLWFLDYVWPLLLEDQVDLKLYVAGRNIPNWLKNQKIKNVSIVGEVDSAVDFMQSKAVMIVPLFSGSGMRIKIIEAMALGKPIVATTLAAEGIMYSNKDNIMIADTPESFADAIREVLSNWGRCIEIGTKARKFVERQHETSGLVQQLTQFYHSLTN